MNKEELIGKLQMVYIGDINALNEMIGYYDGLKEVIEMVQQENKELHNKIDKYKDLEQSLTFIKNRVKQGMTQENINKCAIQLVNSYLKDSDVDDN
jgi:hypothetical protein